MAAESGQEGPAGPQAGPDGGVEPGTIAFEPSQAPDGLGEPAASTAPGSPGESGSQPADPLPHRARARFRSWRRTRPFWGGLLITAGGGEILFSEKAPIGVVLHIGAQGLTGYLLPAMMVLCGLLLWFAPAQRTFYGILSVLLALGTWLTSNLGGFLIGMLLGVLGGSLAFGWSPTGSRKPPKAAAQG